jgi:hypothetical protein
MHGVLTLPKKFEIMKLSSSNTPVIIAIAVIFRLILWVDFKNLIGETIGRSEWIRLEIPEDMSEVLKKLIRHRFWGYMILLGYVIFNVRTQRIRRLFASLRDDVSPLLKSIVLTILISAAVTGTAYIFL